MSGQMSNGEIEGVLASIRRLLRDDATDGVHAGGAVADEAFSGDGPQTGRATEGRDAVFTRPPRRLVLNPDAMVPADTAEDGHRFVRSEAEPLVLTDPAPQETLQYRARAIAGAGTDLTDDPAVAAWSTPLLLSDPVVVPGGPFPGGIPERPDARLPALPDDDDLIPQAVWHPAAPASAAAAPTRRPTSLEERIAELEAALARDEAAWEPDGGDPAPGDAVSHGSLNAPWDGATPHVPASNALRPRLGPAEVRAWIEAESLRAFGTLPDDIADAVAGATLPPAAQGRDPASGAEPSPDASGPWLDPEGGAVPATRIVPDVEDGAGAEKPAGSVAETGGRAAVAPAETEAASVEVAQSPVPDLTPPAAAAAGPVADRGLDPALAAAIRALVADTIRAELRGPLGEELTRSIRRLVRRECARLSSASG